MKRLFAFFIAVLSVIYTHAQDNCSNAIFLCASNKITATTAAATASPSDPALSCGDGVVNNSVWFIVQGIAAGTATVTVTLINNTPGLEMQVYTGTCGSLVPLGPCTSGTGPNGSMSLNFAVAAGVNYYIMVDGTNGNQESFDIQATTAGNAILARPDPNFNTNPASGCNPLSVFLENTTILNGGTNITYQWRIDGVPYPATGADTTILLTGMGIHTVELRVCNSECGCKAIVQEVVVQDLVPVINYSPVVSCIGTPLTFNGSATIQPDPPFVNPVITSWLWDFGDPASGANNTSTLQNPTHTFVGPGNSFTVKLVVDGTCGPDSTTLTVNLLQPPVVNAGSDQVICEGASVNLNALVTNATAPVNYSWSGPGSFSCTDCQSPSVSGLVPGGPYEYVVNITDSNGCIASDTVHIMVNATPVVDAGTDATVCRWSFHNLSATVITGTGPFTYNWQPSTGLDDETIQNPTAWITGDVTYCVTVTDSAGCISAPDCIDITVFPPPSVTSASTSICAGDPPPLTNTFDVTGAGAGSTYSWTLSADYNLISNSNSDSSSVTATFPATPGSYSFTAVVTDGVTGCIDTISTSFSVDPPPTFTVNGPFTICEGESVNLTASGTTTYNWTSTPAYPFTDPSQPNQLVSPVVTTTFVVTGTTGSCVVTDSVQVTVNPLPVAVVAPIPPICGCDSLLLDGTGSSPGMIYAWSSSSGSTIADPAALVTSAYACDGDNFTLTVTDSVTGCMSTSGESVIQNPKPAAVAAVNPDFICNGVTTSVNLSGTGSDTSPGTVYTWNSSPPVSIADPTSLNTTATVNTMTTFTLTVTDSNGCDSTVSAVVNIYPEPIISASPNSLCTSDPVQQVTIQISGAEPGSGFNWSVPACVTPSTPSGSSQLFDFSACGPGNFMFTVIVTQGISGCVDTLSISIPIDTGVTVVTTPDQAICEGDSVTLTASGATNYTWNTGATTTSITVSPSLAGSPHIYTVIGSTGGCSDTASVSVTVFPIPQPPVISGPNNLCEGTTGSVYSVTGSGSSVFTWNVTGGVIVSGQGTTSITVDWGTAGSGNITVFETNTANCPGPAASYNVTINPEPVTSAISGPITICEDSTGTYSVSGLAGSNFNWLISGGVITSGQGTNTVNITWSSSGAGSLTVTETSSAGCTGTPQNLNVTINPNPVTSAISGPDSICGSAFGIQYSVTATPGSVYNWVVSGGNLVSGQGSDVILVDWPAPPGGTITVSEENSGCTGSPVSLNVFVAAVPSASASATDTICNNEILQLTGTVANGTVMWSTNGSGNFDNPSLASPTYTPSPSDSGTFTFTLTVSNPPCSDAVSMVDVVINPAPPDLNISGPASVCEGDMGSAYSVAANFNSSFNWLVNGGSITSGQGTNSILVDWGTAGTGTVIITDTNTFGCVAMPDTFSVAINPIPATSPISGDTAVCSNSVGIVYSVPNTPGINYTWNISGGVITGGQGTNSITVDWTSPGASSITLTETSVAGCSGPVQTYIVNIQAPPVSPAPQGPLLVCADTASVIYFVNANPGASYNWIISGGSISGGQGSDSINVIWSQPGTGTITVLEISNAGCPGNPESINVSISSVPVTSSVSGPTIVCEATTGSVYSVTNTSGSTYNWQITGGMLVSGQGTNTVTVDWGSAGFGSLTVTETNSDGCTGESESINVIINAIPDVLITSSPVSICEGETINLSATGGQGTITWTADVPGTFSNPNDFTTGFNTNTTGVVNFSIILANNPCPADTEMVSVLINPNPSVGISATSINICSGTTVTLTATGAVSYSWSPGGETTSSINITPASTTTYIVTGSDNNSCINSDTITITVTPAAIADAGPDITICNGIQVPVSGTVSNSTGGIWTSSGFGTFIPANNVLIAFYQPTQADLNAGTVTLYLTTQGGCSVDVDSLVVTFVDGSDLYAGPDQQIASGATAQLAGSAVNTQNITWTTLGTGSFQPNNNILNPVYVPSGADYAAGSVTLVLNNGIGCSDTMRIEFTTFIIPNVITPLPHTPGYNDTFMIKGLPDESELLIFDRWGIKVFESSNYQNDWDAPNLADDTYFYILSLRNGQKYNGIIRVIRNKK